MKKKVIGTYWCTIQLDIFRTAVLVLVAKSREDIIEDLPAIYNELGIDREAAAEDIKMIEKEWAQSDDEYFMPPGYTIRLANDAGDVIMMFKADSIADVSEGFIVHETHHATSFILGFRGIDDEECEAYMQEYMYNTLMCKINDWNNKHKKKKK
jgi:hypothetical protein